MTIDDEELAAQIYVLGSPLRFAIFKYVREAGRSVYMDELIERFELQHASLRRHLRMLVDASLFIEGIDPPSGPGRPPLRWDVNPAADSRWGTKGPYERLACLLAEVLRTGESPREVGRREGLERAEGIEAQDGAEALVIEMGRQGFSPRAEQLGAALIITAETCPFESAALVDPGTVCDLHLGMAEGIAEGWGDVQVTGLWRRDPSKAGCRFSCRLPEES